MRVKRSGQAAKIRRRRWGIMALVLAGLAAEGYTEIDEIGYILRGYECFDEKLRSLGAEIEMINSEKEAQKFRLRCG